MISDIYLVKSIRLWSKTERRVSACQVYSIVETLLRILLYVKHEVQLFLQNKIFLSALGLRLVEKRLHSEEDKCKN